MSKNDIIFAVYIAEFCAFVTYITNVFNKCLTSEKSIILFMLTVRVTLQFIFGLLNQKSHNNLSAFRNSAGLKEL